MTLRLVTAAPPFLLPIGTLVTFTWSDGIPHRGIVERHHDNGSMNVRRIGRQPHNPEGPDAAEYPLAGGWYVHSDQPFIQRPTMLTDDPRDIEIERLHEEVVELRAAALASSMRRSVASNAFLGALSIGTLGAGLGRAWGALGQYWGGWIGMAAGAALGVWIGVRIARDGIQQ